jgi:hypothetical protein
MNRILGLASALCAAGYCLSAAAQQPLTPTQPNTTVVTAPVVVESGKVVEPASSATTPAMTSAPSAASVRTTQAEAAPFKPAPLGTYVETTAGNFTMIGQRGYELTFDKNGRREESYAMLTDGFGAGQIYPPDTAASFWPLQVGKSVTFNYGANSPISVTARVLRTETINVPAGTFYTYVIERRDHSISDFSENVATYWYAPSVGTVVKFVEARKIGKSRPAYEVTGLVLPHPLDGAVAVTTPGDTPDRRAAFCQQRGTTLGMADGRSIPVPCITYVQANLPTYQSWLNGEAASVPVTR